MLRAASPFLIAGALALPSAAWADGRSPADITDAIAALPPDAPAEQRAALHRELQEAKRTVATVVLKIDANEGAVFVDGAFAADLPLERPLYLEPGARTIAVEVPKRRFVPIEAKLEPGQNVAITLRELDPLEAPPPARPLDKPVWPGVVLAGVGAAGIGLGIGLVVASFGKESDAEAEAAKVGSCDLDDLTPACDRLATTVSERNGLRNGSYVAFIAGGVAALSTVAYFLIPYPDDAPDAARVGVAPAVGPDGAGLTIGGSF